MKAMILQHPKSPVQFDQPHPPDPRDPLVMDAPQTSASIVAAQAATIEDLQRIIRALSREMAELLAAHHHIVTTEEGRDFMRGIALEAIARTDSNLTEGR